MKLFKLSIVGCWSISWGSPSKLNKSWSAPSSWFFFEANPSSDRSEASNFNFSAMRSPLVRSSGCLWGPAEGGGWWVWTCSATGTGTALITESTRRGGGTSGCCCSCGLLFPMPSPRSKSSWRQSRVCKRRDVVKHNVNFNFDNKKLPAAPTFSACGELRCVLQSHRWSPIATLLLLKSGSQWRFHEEVLHLSNWLIFGPLTSKVIPW